jgi:hypothetical protein
MRRTALSALWLLAVMSGTASGQHPWLLRSLRIYGGADETAPPILLLAADGTASAPGYPFVTVEVDVDAAVPPPLVARFVHCRPNWQESNNVFLHFGATGTTLFSWEPAPANSRYYSYRGRLRIPNPQVAITYAGNWKVQLVDASTSQLVAEARFFAVKPQALCRVVVYSDLYDAPPGISPAAVTLEAWVQMPDGSSIDQRLHTVVFYRNHRWCEPYIVSSELTFADFPEPLYRQPYRRSITGMLPGTKVFRAEQLPAQNEYRVLDLSNPAQFPPNPPAPLRLPLADLRRNGSFWEWADDGAAVTAHLAPYLQDYVPVEFVLDPEGAPPLSREVFVVGSFNNWCATPEWRMSYDPGEHLYRLRQLVRRGRHNYLYATGRVNADTGSVEELSFEEWEGNTTGTRTSFWAFVYYRAPDFGGYDALVAVGAATLQGPLHY